MARKPQNLSNGQEKQVIRIVRKQILSGLLIILALLGGITGLSLWQIKCRLEQRLETLVAKQFEEPRIQKVVSDVAATKAEALLMEQINPDVEKFKAEIRSRLDELQSILVNARSSKQEIEKLKNALFGLQSDFIKINRGLVEIQYFTHKGGMSIPNPYLEQIQKKLNEILAIAIPNPQERANFVKELDVYKLKE